mmetsp:Transcript_23457/g.61441  ORF Transcript_23457/g.61441 Transcript_23457/m.61441 type:complete len:134 (+) Transcript_23457:28-429(+)
MADIKAKAEVLQKEMGSRVEELQRISKELAKCRDASQKFDTQLQENSVVQKELGLLEADGRVFKLMGPVLVPQSLEESKMNVDKRIEYIETELKRYKEVEEGLLKKKDTAEEAAIKAQEKLQKLQVEAAARAK